MRNGRAEDGNACAFTREIASKYLILLCFLNFVNQMATIVDEVLSELSVPGNGPGGLRQ